ncbi:glycosyltransferase [Shimia sp. R9_1]|uniref:glycosyltransferase family 2 protein n=1 Tax=Shimia sp. R9_1 TaxID=2821111 RepID=UPI001ADBB45D|nr:glycosyltransferase family 2 protein [Shimia sp. R9_1]MBO9408901.1 glycosyltransferase [Shimia sp. R9_1]
MAAARLQKLSAPPLTRQSARLPLARALIERNTVTPWQVFYALQHEAQWDASLPEILTARGWISEPDMRALLAERHDLRQVDLSRTPPAAELATLLPPEFCLQHSVLPWARLGETVILLTGRPQALETLRAALPDPLKSALFAVASRRDIEHHIALFHRKSLTHRAETSVAEADSCRTLGHARKGKTAILLAVLTLIAGLAAAFPTFLRDTLLFWTLLTLMGAIFLRLAALYQAAVSARDPTAANALPETAPPTAIPQPLPRISVLVPLFDEPEIASALIQRLTHLTYPRALLEIVLVLEEKDTQTRAAIAKTRLPRWMRVVEVPAGSGITTKPRALNYALPFCRGDIIGVWDAEDAPASDQLEKVAAHFARAAPDVACLQGTLDYYNPYTNWLSRCFTIEYAAWFRLVLPGLSKLGFAIPLGGTTLFFRRAILDNLGGWDSHNVTEDADLGIRLARHGYRTELLDSVTQEEANCAPIAWIRQRSRWLKGYAATYIVHMRQPRLLLQSLGLRGFIGFQLIFLCSLSQFLLAPLLWLLWGAAFGLPAPLIDHLPPSIQNAITALLLTAAATNGAIWITAVAKTKRPRLYKWIFAMLIYFPLATLAAFKGMIEIAVAPFYWDKTRHGRTAEGISHGVETPVQSTDTAEI